MPAKIHTRVVKSTFLIKNKIERFLSLALFVRSNVCHDSLCRASFPSQRCTPRYQEVVAFETARCWAFFFFYLFLLSFSSRVSLIRFIIEVHIKQFVVKALKNYSYLMCT